MNMLVNVDNIKPQFKELKRSHEESVKTSKLKGPLSAGKTYWIKTSGLFGKELIVLYYTSYLSPQICTRPKLKGITRAPHS